MPALTLKKALSINITAVYVAVFVAYVYAFKLVRQNHKDRRSLLIVAVCMNAHIYFLLSGMLMSKFLSFIPSSYPDTKWIAFYYLMDALQAVGGGASTRWYLNNDQRKWNKYALVSLGFAASGVCFHRSYRLLLK